MDLHQNLHQKQKCPKGRIIRPWGAVWAQQRNTPCFLNPQLLPPCPSPCLLQTELSPLFRFLFEPGLFYRFCFCVCFLNFPDNMLILCLCVVFVCGGVVFCVFAVFCCLYGKQKHVRKRHLDIATLEASLYTGIP